MKSKENEPYDVVIIGGGPIGLACGIRAKKAGLKYVILEKGVLVNSLYNYPVNMTFFSTSERLEIGGVPFVSNNNKPTRSEALEYYRRIVTSFDLNIHLFEKVTAVKKSGKNFKIQTSKSEYKSLNIVMAMGFYDIPYLLDVKGEQLPKVKHYYDDPHYYAFQKVLVVGAANSAIDAALETWRKGAIVTMVIRGDKISDRVKYWVKPDIENRIKEGSIKAYFNSEIKEIREHEVDIQTPEGTVTVENDWLLAMTGYKPNLEFLQQSGIKISEDDVCKPDYNEKNYETNVKGIYLAGVMCGGLNTHRLFIENSRVHAQKIIQDIVAKRKKAKS
ncbi:YpdA family putative bacillithiol disulfide reductase [Hanamia caeni]|uniref:YpdA family putative bacillithiol disulfide reductase n=1 Tax=Hanamia caeni TaxID=2294116 RepID=A0A3M9NKP4_9BACT|nr:YpdA family putative bacillithiol disulfide reductase [Hanamia caeni]RNI37917.1 YpdA family putative bacillithiol disulfide reductase [Hanamia caeni]